MADKEFEELAKALGMDPKVIKVMQDLDDCELQKKSATTKAEQDELEDRYQKLLQLRDELCAANKEE